MTSPVLAPLSALAFHRASSLDANQAIDEARGIRSAHGGEAVSYEVLLPPAGVDEFLTHLVLPKLVYFLDCRGVKVPESGAIFVSLFSAQGLLFVDAGVLVEHLTRARGLTLAEVVRRYGSQGVGDPPLLSS